MQNADVKMTRQRGGIIAGQVRCYGRLRKTLAMNGDIDVIDPKRFGFIGGKQVNIFRQPQFFGDLAGGIVIARDNVHRYSGFPQPGCSGYQM